MVLGILFGAMIAEGQTCTTSTCTAASVSESAVLAALPASGNTNPTVVVNIPAGSATWTSALNYSVPAAVTNLTIQGATTVNCTGTAGQSTWACTATDSTVIIDGFTPNGQNHLIQITTGGTSTNFRITGITFKPIANAAKNDGLLVIGGNSHNVKIDHNHFDENGQNDSMSEMVGDTLGVADHNRFDLGNQSNVGNGFRDFASSDGIGNQAWANATNWGTTEFWYLESNVFNGGSPTDCYNGAKLVVRYNTIHNIFVMALHGTKNDAGAGRSCRATEIYHNYADGSPNSDAIVGQNGGPSLIWGNNLAAGFNRFNAPGAPRNFVGGDSGISPWSGNCGTTVRSAAGQGGTDAWDGNSSSSTGYPCLDGVGRGQGDLISIGSPAYPHQKLEPEYMWMNTLAAANEGAINDVSSQYNRDVYPDCGNAGSACSGSFNGTQGTGFGLHSGRPGTCTAGPGSTFGGSPTGSYGVGYWETDTNTFFVCDGSPANHWQAIYTPLAFPYTPGATVPTPTFSPAAGTYATAQNVSILDSQGTADVQITTNEGSNANASNGDTPSRNLYTNCATSCVAGVWQPVNSGIVSNGQLACTTAAQSSGVTNGCAARSVVSSTITGTGTHALDNGKGAGGNDSLAAITATYGGSTANPCSAQFSGLSAGWLGLNFPVPVSNSAAFYSLTTTPSNFDSSLLAPNKNTMTQALSDAIDHYLTVSCMDINNTSATGVHAEFDTNHTIANDDYFGFGKHFNFSSSKMFYCLQGCSGWKEMDLKEPDGTVHTTFSWPANHKIFIATVDHREPGCSPSSSSSCEFYDAACFQDVTAGTPQFCGNWIDSVTGNTPGGKPVNKAGFTPNEVNTQTQIDINAGSVTISQNVWRTFVGYNLNGVEVYYTNDGSTPTTSSRPYVLPVSVATSQTLKALATAPGFTNSTVGSAAYTITPVTTYTLTVTSPNATVLGTTNTSGTYASGTTLGAYTITPAAGYTITSITGTGSTATCTSSPCGSFTLGANSTLTIVTTQLQVATPTLTPGSGTYASAQTVTIATATSGSSLHYTTDGSTPTCSSTTYSTPISVSTSQTVNAIGCKASYLDSAVGTAVYVIGPAPTIQVQIAGNVKLSGNVRFQ